jgi:hypothetical protein
MILDDVKLALRISNTAYDGEITDLIEQVKADMKLAGLVEAKIIDTDMLIKRAIVTYCKANFGLNNPDSEKLQQSYEAIRNHLSMSIDYAYYIVTITASAQGEIIFDGETKQTNSDKVVIFYAKAKNHVQYKLIDKVTRYIDVTGNITIGA